MVIGNLIYHINFSIKLLANYVTSTYNADNIAFVLKIVSVVFFQEHYKKMPFACHLQFG